MSASRTRATRAPVAALVILVCLAMPAARAADVRADKPAANLPLSVRITSPLGRTGLPGADLEEVFLALT